MALRSVYCSDCHERDEILDDRESFACPKCGRMRMVRNVERFNHSMSSAELEEYATGLLGKKQTWHELREIRDDDGNLLGTERVERGRKITSVRDLDAEMEAQGVVPILRDSKEWWDIQDQLTAETEYLKGYRESHNIVEYHNECTARDCMDAAQVAAAGGIPVSTAEARMGVTAEQVAQEYRSLTLNEFREAVTLVDAAGMQPRSNHAD